MKKSLFSSVFSFYSLYPFIKESAWVSMISPLAFCNAEKIKNNEGARAFYTYREKMTYLVRMVAGDKLCPSLARLQAALLLSCSGKLLKVVADFIRFLSL